MSEQGTNYLHTAGPRPSKARNKFVAVLVYGSIIDRSGPDDPKPLILLRGMGSYISNPKYETTNQQKPYSSYYCKSCGVNYDGSTTKKSKKPYHFQKVVWSNHTFQHLKSTKPYHFQKVVWSHPETVPLLKSSMVASFFHQFSLYIIEFKSCTS